MKLARAALTPVLLLAFAFGLAASTQACNGADDSCGKLEAALKRCGMPIARLDCGRIDRTAEEALLARLGTRGCAASADANAVDPRVCALANWSCPVSPTPEPGLARPRYPLVLVGGIDSSPSFDWNPSIATALTTAGIAAYHVDVVAWSPTAERAEDLAASIESRLARTPAGRVNLVCYAVAGLDCRYLVSPGGLAVRDPVRAKAMTSRIASITTIATPHRGTRVAEAALSALTSGTADDLLHSLVGAIADGVATPPSDAALASTLRGLTLTEVAEFNRKIPDASDVYYQSFAGVSHVLGKSSEASERSIRRACVASDRTLQLFEHPGKRDVMNELLWATAPFGSTSLTEAGTVISGPSDGMISVDSAQWGNFRGCLPADHYDVIGQLGKTTRDPISGFDAPRFYQWVASDLAARGL
jgi:triacylglycerol lipase